VGLGEERLLGIERADGGEEGLDRFYLLVDCPGEEPVSRNDRLAREPGT